MKNQYKNYVIQFFQGVEEDNNTIYSDKSGFLFYLLLLDP